MTIPRDSIRVKFASSLKKSLYKELQKKSEDSGVPISKLLDQAVEKLFAKTITIEDKELYSYLCVFFGTRGLDVDEQVENILIEYVDKQKKAVEHIVHLLKERDQGESYSRNDEGYIQIFSKDEHKKIHNNDTWEVDFDDDNPNPTKTPDNKKDSID